MPIRRYKPNTPGTRFRSVATNTELTKQEGKNQPVRPHKPLLEPIKKSGGRNNKGRITTRFRGGGNKRMYRLIDFKRNKYDVPGIVKTIEYDPNRTCRISLVEYTDGEKRYILTPHRHECRATPLSPARRRTFGPATACRCTLFRSAPSSITWNCIWARAGSWYARQA